MREKSFIDREKTYREREGGGWRRKLSKKQLRHQPFQTLL